MVFLPPQIPSFPSLRDPRYSRKTLHRRLCPSASGGHDLACRVGPLERVPAPPVDECLLRHRASLGIHPIVGDLSAVPKLVIALCPGYSVGVGKWVCACGVVVHDIICNVGTLLISEFTVSLLRNVDDCGKVVEAGFW